VFNGYYRGVKTAFSELLCHIKGTFRETLKPVKEAGD